MALHNFSQMWRHFHPMDPSAEAMYRVVLEFHLAGSIVSVKPIDRFFMSVTQYNASVAVNGLPLDYQGCQDMWERINRPKVTYGQPVGQTQRQNGQTQRQDPQPVPNIDTIVSAVVKTIKKNKKGVDDEDQQRKPKKARKHNWCPLFNFEPGCTNTQAGQGCVSADKSIWRHGCNVRLGNRLCSQNHPAFEHQ